MLFNGSWGHEPWGDALREQGLGAPPAPEDIKPENIVVDDEHLLRLVDFGSATDLGLPLC